MTDNVRHIAFTPQQRAFQAEPRLRDLDRQIRHELAKYGPEDAFDSTGFWLDFIKPRANRLVGWDRRTPANPGPDEDWLQDSCAWHAVMDPWIRAMNSTGMDPQDWRDLHADEEDGAA